MNYLEEVITDVLEQFGGEEEHLVFVTTNKRSIVFLRNYFAQQVRGTVFAPTFVSISELFERISGCEEIEPLPLLFEFYDSYRTVKEQSGEEPNTFEEFLSWGSTTLQDFNEIDENLVLPERIFPYMQVYGKGTVNYIDFIKPQVHTAPTSRCRLFVLDTALQPSVCEEVE